MSEIELEKFKGIIKGMTNEELEVIADIIPVELCYNRIGKELKRMRQFRGSVGEALKEMEGVK